MFIKEMRMLFITGAISAVQSHNPSVQTAARHFEKWRDRAATLHVQRGIFRHMEVH
jgi:hypothetical protein